MRKRCPQLGERRTVRRFLFLPTTLTLDPNNSPYQEAETRWLEWAEIEQVYVSKRWEDRLWVNK